MYSFGLSGNQSQYFIKYQPNKGFSLATTLLVQQLEYWFSKQSKKQKFYKFIEPCNHYLYRTGDSWCEEIGITADVFRRTFKKIAVAYKSYGQYQKAQDKFEGKRYASYYNRQTHQTFFIKNYDYDMQQHERNNQTILSKKTNLNHSRCTSDNVHKENHQTINQQFVDYPKIINQQAIYNTAGSVDLNRKSTNSNTEIINEKDDRHFIKEDTLLDKVNAWCDDQISQLVAVDISKNAVYCKPYNAVSLTRVFNNQKIHSISLKEREFVDNFKINKDLVAEKAEPSLKQRIEEKLKHALGQQMISMWQEIVGDPRLSFKSRRLLIDLYTTLTTHFEGSLFHWQAYCKKIASSKFLMGEGKAWKLKQGVFLLWAIKADNIAKINSNALSLGDRAIPLSLEQSRLVAERFDIAQAIKVCQEELTTVQQDVQRIRRGAVREHIEDLFINNDSSLERYQQQFEAMIRGGNIDQDPEWIYQRCSQHLKDQEWREMNRAGGGSNNLWWYFRIYLTQVFADQYFNQTQQQMIKQRQQQIERDLKTLQQKLNQVSVTMKLIEKI